ncbi:hypothetical protein ABH923_003302 [Leifsonia sp. EB41]|uniref:hypothetical protein n=1 Tax=Leifsonia sp. EB41 TaxID=3156260 RepID=UPI0035172AE9
MNQTEHSQRASATVSRRTVAKTAAWAAPAIALSAASPAFATSVQAAVILLDAPSYEVVPGGTVTLTGTIVPATGGTVPSGIGLQAAFSGGSGFTVASGPVVTGSTFTLTVRASATATPSKITVSSWNHPVFEEAQADLTLAAVTVGGAIHFDRSLYTVTSGEDVTITGTLEPAAGTVLPSDILLEAAVEGLGFTLVGPVVVTGNAFAVKVAAKTAGAAGAVSVHSPNYAGYFAARTQVTTLSPGFVDAGYGMVPFVRGWKRTTGSDPAVSWFAPAAGLLTVAAGKLGVKNPWLDMRVGLQNGSTFVDGFDNAPFDKNPMWASAYPSMPSLDLRTEATVVSLTVNGAPYDKNAGIALQLGGSTATGSGAALTGRADPTVVFWPNKDSRGVDTTYNSVFAYLPTTLPKGAVGKVEIVTTVSKADGSRTKIGFVIDYQYK